jgi:hypothetical protein
MTAPHKILLQTTISTTADDWSIDRFSLLTRLLAEAKDEDGAKLFDVTARDRDDAGRADPVLAGLAASDFDAIWLFAVDTGDGLTPADCAGINAFRARGGGVLVARDHMDLGSSVCMLEGVGAANFFHSRNLDPDESRRCIDDPYTADISWPNYHSGANGDFQQISPNGELHPIMRAPDLPGGQIGFLPAHPHEGAVGAPSDDPTARVVATGVSKVSGATFNIAVAFEPTSGAGPAIAQSTFHHFADYNWEPAMGAPSFVSEPPGAALATSPQAQEATRRYATNAALWLATAGRA